MKFKKPYWAVDEDSDLLGTFRDFNRELIPPGTNEYFPDGAVGIRVDDDFWAAAALPWDDYNDKTIQQIVSELWPGITNAKFNPDH